MKSKNINNIKDIVDPAGGFQIIYLNKLEVIDYELCNNKERKIHKRSNDKTGSSQRKSKKEYSNKNIDKTRSYLNYHLKKPIFNNYFKEFKRLKEENSLKGQLHKNSIYACEMIITSDKEFFSSIGESETKRYFKTAFDFVCSYKNLGIENIISAVVHLDKETPHMHLTYIPVVDSTDKEGNPIRKIGGNLFWNKEQNSYINLQDNFYEYISMNGFKLERGKNNPNRNYKSVDDFKEITNFYETKRKEKELEEQVSSIYTSNKSFINYNEFTPESVDKNLLQPLLKENLRLTNKIEELNKKIQQYENTINNYSQLSDENESLKTNIQAKQSEINVLYNLIVRLNEEKDKIVEKCQKMGIDIEK